MFREAAERHGEAEALVFKHRRLTYAELLERATQRARELRALGVARGDRIRTSRAPAGPADGP